MKAENQTADQAPATSGRPRDPRIDFAVLSATTELLLEVGYADLSLQRIAARAGTSKPALYRRWPSKAHLVHEAAFPSGAAMTIPDTGELRTDVRAMLATTLALFRAPVARAALPGLLADVAADPTLHHRLMSRFEADVWAVMRHRLDEAVLRGEARADADPGTLLEAVGGLTLLALLTRAHSDATGPEASWIEPWLDTTTDLLMRGLTA